MKRNIGRGLMIAAMIAITVGLPKIVLALAVLSLVVAIHEAGHYMMARLFGVRIFAFSIFAGPTIARWRWNGTRFQIGTIPIGGYVSSRFFPNQLRPRGDSVREKKWWQQALFALGGIIFNIASGFIVLVALYMTVGKPAVRDVIVKEVTAGSSADRAGLKAGDQILRVDGRMVKSMPDYYEGLARSFETITLMFKREGKDWIVQLSSPEDKNIGASLVLQSYERLSFRQAFDETSSLLAKGVVGLWGLLTGQVSLMKMSGPVGIVGIGQKFVDVGFSGLVHFFTLISFGLAFTNLLPFPALDGSHLVFALLKTVRIEPSEKAYRTVQTCGMVVLLGFITVITVKDIFYR